MKVTGHMHIHGGHERQRHGLEINKPRIGNNPEIDIQNHASHHFLEIVPFFSYYYKVFVEESIS